MTAQQAAQHVSALPSWLGPLGAALAGWVSPTPRALASRLLPIAREAYEIARQLPGALWLVRLVPKGSPPMPTSYFTYIKAALLLAKGGARLAQIESDPALDANAKKAAVVAELSQDCPALLALFGAPAELTLVVGDSGLLGEAYDGVEEVAKLVKNLNAHQHNAVAPAAPSQG